MKIVWWCILVIGIAVAIWGLFAHAPIDLAFFARERALLFTWAEFHPVILSGALFVAYVIATCLALPLSSLLCVLSGIFLPLGVALILGIGAETIGAYLLFVFARFITNRSALQSKLLQWKQKLRQGTASYLLFLRVSHLLPYILIDVLAATVKVPTRTLLWTTALGVFPFVLFMTNAGSSIKHAFQQGRHMRVDDLFTWKMRLLLIALGAVTLFPLILKKK